MEKMTMMRNTFLKMVDILVDNKYKENDYFI